MTPVTSVFICLLLTAICQAQWPYTWESEIIATVQNPKEAEISDLDQDGLHDVVIFAQDSIHWIENNGEGVWNTNTITNPIGGGRGSVGDLDGDGMPDLVIHENWSDGIYWLRNLLDEAGEFSAEPLNVPIPHYAVCCPIIVDMNGDDLPDILFQSFTDCQSSDGTGTIAWFENVDFGEDWIYHAVYDYSSYTCSADMKAADLDGDEDVDIVFVDSDYNEESLYTLRNLDGVGTSWNALSIDSPTWFADLYDDLDIGDVEPDGDMDFLVNAHWSGDPGYTGIYLFQNTGNQVFWYTTLEEYYDLESEVITFSALEDFDADGDLDVLRITDDAHSMPNYPDIAWYENLGGTYQFHGLREEHNQSVYTMSTGRLNADAFADIVTFELQGLRAIYAPNPLEILLPDPGASCQVGDSLQVEWCAPGGTLMQVLLVADGQTEPVVLAENLQSSNGQPTRYTLPIPVMETGPYTLVVSDMQDPPVYNASTNGVLHVLSPIALESHNEGGELTAGSQQIATWSTTIPTQLEVEIRVAGEFHQSLGLAPAGVEMLAWQVPMLPAGSSCRLHLRAVIEDIEFMVESSQSFTVTPPFLLVLPTPGSQQAIGTDLTISWNRTVASPTTVELWIADSLNHVIHTDWEGEPSIVWSIPPLPLGGQAHIRLRTEWEGVAYESQGPAFTLANPVLVHTPASGAALQPGDTVAVTWTATIGENVALDLLQVTTPIQEITPFTPNDGAFDWQVPLLPLGPGFRVRAIVEAGGFVYQDHSSGFFELVNPITLLEPASGAQFSWDQPNSVIWETTLPGELVLSLSHNGSDLGPVLQVPASAGEAAWLPGLLPSGPGYRLHLRPDFAEPVYADSSGLFSLTGPGLVLHEVQADTVHPCFVNLLFRVSDAAGRGIPFLQGLEQFLAEENGNPLSPSETLPWFGRAESFPFRQRTLLMLDNSFSIGLNLEQVKEAARTAVRSRFGEQEIALWTFAEDVIQRHEYSTDSTSLLAAIVAIPLGEPTTNLYGAVIQAIEQMEDQYEVGGVIQHSLLLLGDGEDTQGTASFEQALAAVQGRQVFTVAVGEEADTEVLAALGSAGFSDGDFAELPAMFAWIQMQIADYAHSFYRLAYLSPSRNNPQAELALSLLENPVPHVLQVPFSSEGFSSLPPGVYINRGFDALAGQVQLELAPDSLATTLRAETLFGLQTPVYEWTSLEPALLQVESVQGESGERARLVILDQGPLDVVVRAEDSANGLIGEIRITRASTGIDAREGVLPEAFALSAPYPNPFNASTHLDLDLPQETRVTAVLFNLQGRKVLQILAGESLAAGRHRLGIDGSELASGVYFLRARTPEGQSAVSKLLLLK